MWAPADLFTPATNAVTLSLGRVVSFFYRDPVALLALLLTAVAGIVVATLVSGRLGAKR